LSNVQLARKISLSPPAAHSRLRRLEKDGYIRQYTAVVDREKAGYDLLCFIHISLQMHQVAQVEKFREATRRMPEVLECHHITGEYDYLLKVVLKNRKDLERFVVDKITPIPGVARIHTSLVFTEVKSTMALPLD
jgi:DNA-binding Lrp family transcriptional regulator